MMISFYSLFSYFLSISLFFSCLQPLFFWLAMEINLILFIYLMFVMDSEKLLFKEECVLFYFLIQSLGSFMFLMSIYFKEEFLLASDLFSVGSLSLKLGIFPFYFWVMMMSNSLSQFIMIFILSFQKVPMFFIFFSMSSNLVFMFVLFSFLFGSLMVFFSKYFMELLILSSVSSSFFVYIIYMESMSFYFYFFFIYSFSLFYVCGSILNSSPDLTLRNVSFFMFISGLPPFSLFFFKFFMISKIMFGSISVLFLVFWLVSFFSLMGYSKFFYINFFFPTKLYLSGYFSLSNFSYLMFIMLTSILFLY